VRLCDGRFLVFDDDPKPVTVPDETYLRQLMDVDLENPEDILRFTAAYGRLGSPDFARLSIVPYWTDLLRRAREEAWDAPGLCQHVLEPGLSPDVALYLETNPWDVWDVQCLAEFRMHAMTLRDLARIWSLYGETTTMDEFASSWELVGGKPAAVRQDSGLVSMSLEPPPTVEHAVAWLEALLNTGLEPFHVRIEATAKPHFDLYSVLCLQIANHVAESAEYRRCKRCRRLFVRQQGRAKLDQHRVNDPQVRYCSSSCARMQAQEEYRKRKAENRRQQGKGEG